MDEAVDGTRAQTLNIGCGQVTEGYFIHVQNAVVTMYDYTVRTIFDEITVQVFTGGQGVVHSILAPVRLSFDDCRDQNPHAHQTPHEDFARGGVQ